MDIHVMFREPDTDVPIEPRAGFRSGHFHEGRAYETRRPSGGTEWLLIVTVAGRGYHRRGADFARLAPGTALAYAPGVPQHYGTDARVGHWELLWAHFTDEARFTDRVAWPRRPDGASILELGDASARVLEALTDLVSWHTGPSPLRHDFAANALERALLWCDTVNPRHPRTGMDRRVVLALETIADHLTERLDVSTVARRVGISSSRLSHLFTRYVGETLPGYVEARRMERAEALLRMTDRSVSEIARGVGFDDPLYFSRRFSKRHGCGPRVWRTGAIG